MFVQDYIKLFNQGRNNISSWDSNSSMLQCGSIDVIDFFCCAGGMTLGFAALNQIYKILGGVDLDLNSLEAYRKNYKTPILQANICTLSKDSKPVEDMFGISKAHTRPLVMIGCAPCQGFSAHRKKNHGDEDQRNTLIGEFANMAVRYNPDFIVMENVPEILTGKFKNHYMEAKQIFEEYGYFVVQRIYNAAGFYVPQARNRAIIVASKYPNFNLPDEILSENEFVTVRDAIGNLPPITPDSPDKKDIYHRCSCHRQSTIDVISQIPHDGGSRPQGVGPKCLDKVSGFYDVYGRLAWDRPAITITQYARNPASGRFSHPEQNRGLSIREAARLQSFPDGYIWNGSLGDNFRQIGEAVPPLLSLAIATQIALILMPNNEKV